MRVRRRVFFGSALAISLIVLLPLRLAIGWFDLGGRGLAAREASGSLWAGTLKEAEFGPVALGDVHARLNVLPLLIGRARLSLSRDEALGRFSGAISVSRHGFGLEDLTGQIRLGALFAPAPVTVLDLDDVSAHFTGGRCETAEGGVRAAGLTGTVRCAEGDLLVPLASQSGLDRVALRVAPDGHWRIDLGGAAVRRIEGSF